MKGRRISLLVAVSMLFAPRAFAQAPATPADNHTALTELLAGGMRARNNGDCANALRLLKETAEASQSDSNSVWATNLLADMYWTGKCVPQNDQLALVFYSRAAASGDMLANFNVGVIASQLHAYDKAFVGYRNAAEKGNARAESMVAHDYQYGLGVQRDDAKAVEWFQKSATHGDAYGESGLAYAYSVGMGGLAKDPVQAEHWYRRSAASGYAIAQVNLGIIYSNGKGVATDYKEALHWYRLAAEQDLPDALNGYAYSLDRGLGADKDLTQALTLYRRAAQYGQPNAMQSLAAHYLRGDGVTVDLVEGLYWALLAERFYEAGAKHDQAQQMAVSAETRIDGDKVWAVKDRVASFKPKTPPRSDMPAVEKVAAPIPIRAQLRSDAKFRLYSAVFAVALDADGQVLSLRLVNVIDPASGTNEPVDIAVPASYIDAVRDKLSKKRPNGTEEGKAASFATFFFFSPSYPSTVITDLDKGVDDQP